MTRSSVKGRMPRVLGSAALALALAAGMAGVSASSAGGAQTWQALVSEALSG